MKNQLSVCLFLITALIFSSVSEGIASINATRPCAAVVSIVPDSQALSVALSSFRNSRSAIFVCELISRNRSFLKPVKQQVQKSLEKTSLEFVLFLYKHVLGIRAIINFVLSVIFLGLTLFFLIDISNFFHNRTHEFSISKIAAHAALFYGYLQYSAYYSRTRYQTVIYISKSLVPFCSHILLRGKEFAKKIAKFSEDLIIGIANKGYSEKKKADRQYEIDKNLAILQRPEEERLPFELRIQATRELIKLNAFILPSIQKAYDQLPSSGSRQAAMIFTWLYYDHVFSEEDLITYMGKLNESELTSANIRKAHFFGLEGHTSIPEPLDTLFSNKEINLKEVARWLQGPDAPQVLKNRFQALVEKGLDSETATEATFAQMLDKKELADSFPPKLVDSFMPVLNALWQTDHREFSAPLWRALNRQFLHQVAPDLFPSPQNRRSKIIQSWFDAMMDVQGNRDFRGEQIIKTVFEARGLEVQSLPSSMWFTQAAIIDLWQIVSLKEEFKIMDHEDEKPVALWAHINFNGDLDIAAPHETNQLEYLASLVFFITLEGLIDMVDIEQLLTKSSLFEARGARLSKLGMSRTELTFPLWISPSRDKRFSKYASILLESIDLGMSYCANRFFFRGCQESWEAIKCVLPPLPRKITTELLIAHLRLAGSVVSYLHYLGIAFSYTALDWEAVSVVTFLMRSFENAKIAFVKSKDGLDYVPAHIAEESRMYLFRLRKILVAKGLWEGLGERTWNKLYQGTAQHIIKRFDEKGPTVLIQSWSWMKPLLNELGLIHVLTHATLLPDQHKSVAALSAAA